MTEGIEPFRINIPQAELDDLKRRLKATRFPEEATAEGWTQGVPLATAKQLRDYWAEKYDWRRCEEMLNGLGQSRTVIDGVGIHFLHVRSPEPNAMPLLLTHGWPGSVIEFVKVIAPLADPVKFGGKAEDAFHVVVPSLPGYGFSDKPEKEGWGVEKIADAWVVLMQRLGYDKFAAQGGDWGAAVTSALGVAHVSSLHGIHLNMPIAFPDRDNMGDLSEQEKKALAAADYHQRNGRGYSEEQRTRPQTLGYSLADSPMGQACWIYEKFREWADCNGDPLNTLTMDEMLDNIMLYWLTNSGASSARLYWQSLASFPRLAPTAPLGVSCFPKEIVPTSRRWAEKRYPKIFYWNELDRGGHFAAFEVPDLFVQEMRACFRLLRN